MRRLTLEEREQLKIKKLQFKDKYELRLKGGYERIYPLTEDQPQSIQQRYDYLIAASKEVWGEQTSGGGVNAKKKIEELDKKFNHKTTASTPVVHKAQTTKIPVTDKI